MKNEKYTLEDLSNRQYIDLLLKRNGELCIQFYNKQLADRKAWFMYKVNKYNLIELIMEVGITDMLAEMNDKQYDVKLFR